MIYGHRNGFETNKNGFSLAGPKYFKRFLETCSEFISVHGARFFKFDGTHARTHACNDNCTACHGWTRVWIVTRSRWTLTGLVLLLLTPPTPPTPPTPVTGGRRNPPSTLVASKLPSSMLTCAHSTVTPCCHERHRRWVCDCRPTPAVCARRVWVVRTDQAVEKAEERFVYQFNCRYMASE